MVIINECSACDLNPETCCTACASVDLYNAAAPVLDAPTPSGSQPPIPDCPRCEERNNCTMWCPGDVEPKTYIKSATADELSRNQVIRKSAAASALEALTSSEAVAPAPHHEDQSK